MTFATVSPLSSFKKHHALYNENTLSHQSEMIVEEGKDQSEHWVENQERGWNRWHMAENLSFAVVITSASKSASAAKLPLLYCKPSVLVLCSKLIRLDDF